MPELLPQERLYPSLLDRLTDQHPEKKQEPRSARIFSISKLREAVIRDLVWLLNTCHLEATEDLEDYPLVKASVLNFGIPDLTGKTISGLEVIDVQRELRRSICDFEPRIARNTLEVRTVAKGDHTATNSLAFEIEGDLWSHPVPERLFLRTELDLETGTVTVSD